jgi:M6 family metalloprotease-like protein
MLLPISLVAQTDVEELGRRHGATPPLGYYEMLRTVPDAFQFSSQNGWIMRGRSVAEVRQRARGRMLEMARDAVDAPMALVSGGAQASQADAVAGDLDIPVFLILYVNSDSAALVENVSRDVLEQRLYGTQQAPPYSVHTYYRELSNDALLVNGTVFPWTRVSRTSLHYEGDGNGLDSSGDIPGLIEDIVAAHDDTVDFGQFDNDGPDGIPNSGDDDGLVDAIVLIHPKVDGSCKNRNPDAERSIWAHRFRYSAWTFGEILFTDDSSNSGTGPSGAIGVNDYIVQGGQGGDDGCSSDQPQAMGVVAHETGHLLGLPDLYDQNTGGGGIGHWGLMGSGNHQRPHRPAHMMAWSKAQLGWVTEVLLDRDTTLDISPVVTSDTTYVLPIPDSHEYFLLENRQPIGSDSALHGVGLLIWHPDTLLIGNRGNQVNGFLPYALPLVQADGRDDLRDGDNRGDEGDTFPGSENNTSFGLCTTPASEANSSRPSMVVLENITQVEDMGPVSVDVTFFDPVPVAAVEGQPPPDGFMGASYFHRFTATGGIECKRQWTRAGGSFPPGLLLSPDGQLWGNLNADGEYTAEVQVASGLQSDTITVTISVAIPALEVDAVVEHLLTEVPVLSTDEVRYLDLQGNRNGGFDLGDFLGWIEQTGGTVTAAEMAEVIRRAGDSAQAAGRKP